ncbi:hypothetical protein [Sphingomonas sp. Leaf343]|uniref:hypothetical protein n=1 Tax=Sphingomonas sp. Leaf343 TaxID=1736345 RepID=UPI0006FAC754|nr:hypothetical protein [Sphingomonas sp. Leaf343]KQR83478.1 hypothetical protein ASG07_07055 [Sphingomonas sp. Leaf343]
MTYADPRLHRPRTVRALDLAARFDAGAFDVEFHVDGCDCHVCVDADLVDTRLDANIIGGIGAAGLVMGAGFGLLLAFCGHPTETTSAVLAIVGIYR